MTYLVDIDGTLADCRHRLHHIEGTEKNWDAFYSACEEDDPIEAVVTVIAGLEQLRWSADQNGTPPLEFVYLTGRPEAYRGKTESWMEKRKLPRALLLMRKDGDFREDVIVKKEALEQLIMTGRRVVAAFEDRPSVCRMWREMGLTVFQITDKEF